MFINIKTFGLKIIAIIFLLIFKLISFGHFKIIVNDIVELIYKTFKETFIKCE